MKIANKRPAYTHRSPMYRSNLLCSKRSFDLPFSWIFAIIAGTFILFISIYATTRFIGTTRYIAESEAGNQLAILLNPVVNGITSAYATKIDLKKETRIYSSCQTKSFNSPYFGRQTLAFSEESGFIKKWDTPGANISLINKYLFSESIEQGKTIYIFSKPFYTGFRVDDLVFLSLNKYCFVSAPSFIQEEVTNLNLKNVNLSDKIDSCSLGQVRVCFDFFSDTCNISVYGTCSGIDCENSYDSGYVRKNGKQMNYYGSLMYAAIFSSPENYNCNLIRLGNKISELASIYNDKVGLVKPKGCDSIIDLYLDNILLTAKNLTSSKLTSLYDSAKLMDKENCNSNCQIYSGEKC